MVRKKKWASISIMLPVDDHPKHYNLEIITRDVTSRAGATCRNVHVWFNLF